MEFGLSGVGLESLELRFGQKFLSINNIKS
jgi:hypothetical protein